jgi:hypothetical protein
LPSHVHEASPPRLCRHFAHLMPTATESRAQYVCSVENFLLYTSTIDFVITSNGIAVILVLVDLGTDPRLVALFPQRSR